MSKSNKRKILSHLKVLMMHIFKWETQEDKRSTSWVRSIDNARKAIKETQVDVPSLTDDFLKSEWENTLKKAKSEAEEEMSQKTELDALSWDDVFKKKYLLAFLLMLFCAYCFW